MGELAETLKARIAARREASAPEERCGNCAAFDKTGLRATYGRCRRGPPTFVIDHGSRYEEWPRVRETDWCLDHVPGEAHAD